MRGEAVPDRWLICAGTSARTFPPHSTSTESENGEVSTFLLGVVILAVVLVVGFVVMTRK
jgi:hypothetical protein